MKSTVKWIAIIGAGLVALIVLALLLIPLFVDVERYKPEIEKQVSEFTGRPFEIKGKLQLSLFPWAVLAVSDLHLGNPPGFEEKNFVYVKSFDFQVKLFPLLFKDIQIKRIVVERPQIVLEKNRQGLVNWEGFGKSTDAVPKKAVQETGKKAPTIGLPIKALAVGEFAITEGSVLYIDQAKKERKELSKLTLRLQDISLQRPIHMLLSAFVDGKPLSLEGKIGPLGKDPGKGTLPLDLVIKALDLLEIGLKGKIIAPAFKPKFDMTVHVSDFSPRKLIAALGQTFPIATADPKALSVVALKANINGDTGEIRISNGVLKLDDSQLNFSTKARDFSKPDVMFDLKLDQINVDRYLPPATGEKGKEAQKKKAEAESGEKPDYAPLRKLVLDGSVQIGKLKVKGASMQDVHLKIVAKNGLINLDPLSLKLYEGNVGAKGILDVRKDEPKTNVNLTAQGIQAGPLLKDLLDIDFLEGLAKAKLKLGMMGTAPERIKKTLNGTGDLVFNDGAIKGIDVAGMLRNVKANFGLAKKGGPKPRTDFSELHVPFTITNGLIDTRNTTMNSPVLRVLAKGKVDLGKETLDMRVEPKFVASLKGQGDTKKRVGLTIPVLVSGTFTAPKFRPDLKGLLEKDILEGIKQPTELKKLLPSKGPKKEDLKSVEKGVKGLLKKLPFSQ